MTDRSGNSASPVEMAANAAARSLRRAANTEQAAVYRPHPEGGYALWASDRDAAGSSLGEPSRLWWEERKGWQLRDNGYYYLAEIGRGGELGLAVCGPWLNPRMGPRRLVAVNTAVASINRELTSAASAERKRAEKERVAVEHATAGLIPEATSDLEILLLRAIKTEANAEDARVVGHEIILTNPRREHEAPVQILREAILRLAREGQDAKTMCLFALADAVDARTAHTLGHSERIREWSVAIALELGLSAQEVEAVDIAAKLHDLATGFTGREALYKARLDESERNLVKRHAELGGQILSGAGYPDLIVRGVRGHHERWDGGGYPDGLLGHDIPLSARIIALPEVFDALTSARPWREPLPIQAAVKTLLDGAGNQFDPDVVTAFLAAWWQRTPKTDRKFITYEN